MKRVLIAAVLVAVAFMGTATLLITSAEAVTPGDAAQLLVGNKTWYAAADDDFTIEWNHYERLGWTIVDADFSNSIPPAGHQVDLWAWFKARNGKLLWTKFRVRDPAVTSDGSYRDYVQDRT